jgi:hypothetical protein
MFRNYYYKVRNTYLEVLYKSYLQLFGLKYNIYKVIYNYLD